MTPTVADIVNRWETGSSPHPVILRLLGIVGDCPVRPEDIADVIRADVALTARLLKVVNSTASQHLERIPTVDQALATLGIDCVTRLTLSTCVRSLLQNVPEANQTMFWRHSLACAVGAAELAKHAGAENPDHAFVAGLFHDVGRLAVYSGFPDEASGVMEYAARASKLLHEAEREIWGYDHAVVGRALMGAWRFPEEVLDVVAFHHTPEASVRFPISTSAVHVSDALVHVLITGGSPDCCVPPISTSAWQTLGLSIGDVASILDDIQEDFSRLALVID